MGIRPAGRPGPARTSCGAARAAGSAWRNRSLAIQRTATGSPSAAGNRRSSPTSVGSRSPSGSSSINADDELRQTALGLRGFFLGDPDELSLLALVDQFATDDAPIPTGCTASRGATTVSRPRCRRRSVRRVKLNTEVVAVSQRGRGRARQPQERPPGRAAVVRVPGLRAAGHRPAAHPDHAGAAAAAARCVRPAEIRTRDQDAAAVLHAASGGFRAARARSDRRCRSAPCGTATRSSAAARAS